MNLIPYIGCLLVSPFAAMLLFIGCMILFLQKPRQWRLPGIFWAFGIFFLAIGVYPIAVLAAKNFPQTLPIGNNYQLFNDSNFGNKWGFTHPSPGDVYTIGNVDGLAINADWMLVVNTQGKFYCIDLETNDVVPMVNANAPKPEGSPTNEDLRPVGSYYWDWILTDY